ncbi:hypothetical protein [Pseudotamlana agarivorans]|uniref:hypothetical protein n=1 Tax=Pseudotamlana agarivorans TaxID=481183 RepID=UPI0012F7D270|nr:hypothetical protein [Tamlana agarivorans]
MKKIFIPIIFVVFTFNSCHLPKYTLGTITPYVDFRTGKWLLNDVQSSEDIKPILNKIATKNFKIFLNDRLFNVSNTNGIIVPNFIPLNPTEDILKDLRNGTAFDYYINIKAQPIKNELGSILIGDNNDNYTNQGNITVEIYNLNTLQIIFHQTAFGTNGTAIFTKNISFANNANSLIIGGLEKIMNEIKKTSKY